MKKNVFDHTLLTVPGLLCQWQTSHRSQVAGIRVEEYSKSSQITHKPFCSTSWIFGTSIPRASGLACKKAAKLKLPGHVSAPQNTSSPGNGYQREEAAWRNLLQFSREEPLRMLPAGLWWEGQSYPTTEVLQLDDVWIWELVAITWAGSTSRGCGHSTCSSSGSLAPFLTGSRHPFLSFGPWGTYSQIRDKCCFTVVEFNEFQVSRCIKAPAASPKRSQPLATLRNIHLLSFILGTHSCCDQQGTDFFDPGSTDLQPNRGGNEHFSQRNSEQYC